MFSKFFFINSHIERKKAQDTTKTDELALVKAAAWAWYQHGSGSEAKVMSEEFNVRRIRRETGPSRYKIEAKEEEGASNSIIQTKKPLLDTYEIQSISRQLDRLIIESGHGNNNNSINVGLGNNCDGRNVKKKKRMSKGFWQKHAVVCGRRDDVVEGTALRGDSLKVNGAF